jgi:transcriptional regulator with XRE-family HTH domain
MNERYEIAAASTRLPAGGVGTMLREWRTRRRLSQMELALDVGVSPRHLSFVETGRSRPSPNVIVALAVRLEVPLREQNTLLLAGGYAPRYSQQSLEAGGLQAVQSALQRLLDAHDPYPGMVLDRQWNVVLANRAAMRLAGLLPQHLTQPKINIYRASLHPEGLARVTVNFEQWAEHLLANLRRSVASSADTALIALENEVKGFPNVSAIQRSSSIAAQASALLVPCVLDLPNGRHSLFTTLTSFGTPRDVTLDEMCVELFYPSDPRTEALLRGASVD